VAYGAFTPDHDSTTIEGYRGLMEFKKNIRAMSVCTLATSMSSRLRSEMLKTVYAFRNKRRLYSVSGRDKDGNASHWNGQW